MGFTTLISERTSLAELFFNIEIIESDAKGSSLKAVALKVSLKGPMSRPLALFES